ncbi:hypothetical protein [Cyclobacterium xiamenense]|uniref:hypothetical protein n=1 Tax=Cyclobacterium xiamenense TaxID=1297121 RepID=UPI0035D0CD3D
MNTKKMLFLMAILFLMQFSVSAQIKMPQASPNSKISQQMGLTVLHLDYSRPGKRDRKDFWGIGTLWTSMANRGK